MDRITFPRPEDIVRLNNLIPNWTISGEDFLFCDKIEGTIEDISVPFQINSWLRMISQRIKDADFSFIMASFYFEKEIPDEQWYKSSCKGVDYFPNFSEDDNRNKFAFEYYSDAYFYKVFSSLEAMAHLMTLIFSLKWRERNRISFLKSVSKIEKLNPELYSDLSEIIKQPQFKKINRIRNDTTHNYSEGHVHSEVVQKEGEISLTIGKYMTVNEKYALMEWMCRSLIKIIDLISSKWSLHQHPG